MPLTVVKSSHFPMPTDEELRAAAIQKVRNWPYQNHRSVMLVYDEKNTVIFPEEFFGRMYMRLKAEGTLDLAFPGMDLNHINRFISHMSNCKLGMVICCLKSPTKPHPVGWGYLYEICGPDGGRRANFAFGYFKEVWGRREHVDLSFFMLKYWLTEFKIDVLYGTTLNPLAFNYSKRFGFQHRCVLPKFFNGVDANLITLTPQTFSLYWERWQAASAPPQAEPTLTLV